MKLIIQIPCFNEAETLPQTYWDLPKSLRGVDSIEVLVIDDGSTDRTAEVARELGIEHIVRLPQNTGLANAFATGLETALSLGADIIVNTDGDNRYQGSYVQGLIRPIIEEKHDIVIGARDFDRIHDFGPAKRLLQRVGSRVVQQIAGAEIPDATSGFRAFSRRAALRLNILSNFSYTLESIIEARRVGLFVTSVPISTNPQTRPSRLFSSVPEFIWKSVVIMARVYLRYEPLRSFLLMSAVPFLVGAALWLRFLYLYVSDPGTPTGHIQSVILGTLFLLFASFLVTLGLLGDLLQTNRQLLEDILAHARQASICGVDNGFQGPGAYQGLGAQPRRSEREQ